MAEWSIASVLKTDVLRGTGGSNPSLSAAKHYQFKIRSPILLNSKVGLFCFYISIGFTKLCLTHVEFNGMRGDIFETVCKYGKDSLIQLQCGSLNSARIWKTPEKPSGEKAGSR